MIKMIAWWIAQDKAIVSIRALTNLTTADAWLLCVRNRSTPRQMEAHILDVLRGPDTVRMQWFVKGKN